MSRPAKAMSRGPCLAAGNAGGQGAAARTAAGTDEPVLLVFGYARLEVMQFPDLVAERLRVAAGQPPAAAPARRSAHTGRPVGTGRSGSKARRWLGWPGWPPGRRRPCPGFGARRLGVRVPRPRAAATVGRVCTPSLTSQFGHALRQDPKSARLASPAERPPRAAKAAQTSGVSSWGTTMITVTLRETAAPG